MLIINWVKVLPVVVSIAVIIAIAILREYSKTFAAIAAVMPINIPLGMWILVSGQDNPSAALTQFSQALLINFIPTIFFMLTAWYLAKLGWGLVPIILASYAVWAVGLAAIFAIRTLVGI